MKSYILLENLVFYAYHGVMPQENKVGNEFTVSLKIKTDVTQASLSDDITQTINYAEVYQIVEKEMSIPSKLLEHAARRITDRLYASFPQIEEIELKLSKRNPPFGGQAGSAGITIIV